MKILLIVAVLGCAAEGVPVQQEKTVESGADVRLIAEVENCKLYRIADGSAHWVYLAKCFNDTPAIAVAP